MKPQAAPARPENLRAAIAGHAARRPDKSALVRDDVIVSYAALAEAVDACAGVLREHGVGAESVAGIAVADEIQHVVVSVALLGLGAKQITLATHDSAVARSDLARRVGVTHVVASAAEHRLDDAVFVEVSEDPRSAPVRAAHRHAGDAGAGGAVLLRTSGTTGSARIAALDDAMLCEQARRHPDYADERLLRLASVEHNNSKRHRLYGLFAGGTAVFRGRGAVLVPELCRRHEVTCLDVSRFHAADLARCERPAGRRLLAGVKLRLGGSAVPGSLRRVLMETVTSELYVRYAATECGTVAIATPRDHDETDPVGRPLDGVTVQVVGPDDTEVPRGTIGRLRLSAPGMAVGYHGDPAATERRFRGGWFHPGDCASLRDDGVLVVHGRDDDMIILNGLNIYPAEIERALERHPAVRAAAALPIPSDVHGQIPVAAVELNDGAAVTVSELRAFARGALSLRAPRKIVVLPAIPRNPSGKFDRGEVATILRGAVS